RGLGWRLVVFLDHRVEVLIQGLLTWRLLRRSLRDRIVRLVDEIALRLRGSRVPVDELAAARLRHAIHEARRRWRPAPSPGLLTIVRSRESEVAHSVWATIARGGVEWHELPVLHDLMLRQPHVERLGSLLRGILDRAGAGHS